MDPKGMHQSQPKGSIMRIAIVAVAIMAIGVLTAAPTAAQQFSATIDGLSPVPPTNSPGIGSGCLTLNPNGTLTFDIVFSGLLSAEIAAHFHGPATALQNAGVKIGLPAGSPKMGTTVALLPGDQADLIAGLWYINIHTALFPGGEIRGQVLLDPSPCSTVPVEESTWGQIKELYRAEG